MGRPVPAERPGVLVVDDDDDYRLLVSLALERDGRLFVAGEAPNLAAGLGVASNTDVDMVLVDAGLLIDARAALLALHAAAPEAVLVASACPVLDELAPPLSGDPTRWRLVSKGTPPLELASQLVARLAEHPAAIRSFATRTFPAETSSAGASRRFVAERLRNLVSPDVLDSTTLLVSELVANAIVYARTGCEVEISHEERALRVAVTDYDRSWLRRRHSGPGDASGRGIDLVEAYADAWGSERSESGKRVWFMLELP
ncbi:MAG: putative sensor protein [Acidimicrobiaceae bacterium]|nr:putative sensor protein [Acidimicrobiaceae bacterium]